MVVLTLIVLLLALFSAPAWALGPPLVAGIDATTSTSAAAGNVYSAGTSLTLNFGSEEDPSNRAGDIHLSYTDQMSPLDPSDSDSNLKHVGSYAGGLTSSIFKNTSIGVDLDHSADSSQSLTTDGMKVSLGYDPLRLSYRHAKDVIGSDFILPRPKGKVSPTYQGIFIYQSTFGMELSLDLGEINSITFNNEYSLFSPDVADFATVLTNPALASVADFSTTLQNFELWSTGATWKHNWSKIIDTSCMGRLAHLIIPGDSLYETTFEVGYKFKDSYHLKLGWDYINSPLNISSTATLELRISWDASKTN